MELLTECVTGGIAACGACLFSNPMEVVKTRMQLQGELKARGAYQVHYRNVFHAFYMIGKVDGILALQKGLVPGLGFQFIMNGIRLGTFQVFTRMNLTQNSDGVVSYPRCMLFGAVSGCIGSFIGSPLYLLKTQLQSRSNAAIAVGTQHNIKSIPAAFRQIYQQHGIIGLWRGNTAILARVSAGSAVQLSAFSKCKYLITQSEFFSEGSIMIAITSSLIASVVLTLAMQPFDVVATRMYNQGVDKNGRGLFYNHVGDAFVKIFRTEGIQGLYKGLVPHYFRLGPHTVLSLVFWDNLKKFVKS